MPYSGWSKDTAQYKGCRDHENYIAEQRYDKGLRSFSKSLQGAGGCDGHGGDDKACADDAQCGFSGCDRNVTKLAPSEKVKIGTRTAHSATEQRLCAVFLKKGMTRKRIEKSAKKSYSKRINYATL